MFITMTFNGPVHDAMAYVNMRRQAANHFFQIATPHPGLCILIFKVPAREDRITVRQELGLKYEAD